jgi:hypothetical protein
MPFQAWMRRALAVVGILVLGAGASACSDDGSGESVRTQDEIVPNARVTTGLSELQRLGDQVAALTASHQEEAQRSAEQAHNQWEEIEARVKKNDPGLGRRFENALSDIEFGASRGDELPPVDRTSTVRRFSPLRGVRDASCVSAGVPRSSC